jgi:hypothetical protein
MENGSHFHLKRLSNHRVARGCLVARPDPADDAPPRVVHKPKGIPNKEKATLGYALNRRLSMNRPRLEFRL